jgi:hypothetical protein
MGSGLVLTTRFGNPIDPRNFQRFFQARATKADVPVIPVHASRRLCASLLGVALVAAQATENTRIVNGIAGAVLGASFVLRAVGDIGDGTLSWFSLIGWALKTRPFAGERWWPFLPMLAATGCLVVATGALAARRDVGGGLVQPRPGRPSASRSLGHPLGLALRLQRGSLIGWSIGLLFTCVAYGSIANGVDEFACNNKSLADMLAPTGGGNLTDSYLATSFGILALVGTGFAVQSTLRLRTEEMSLRAEPLLATPLSRRRWAMSHLAVAFGRSVLVLFVAGLGRSVLRPRWWRSFPLAQPGRRGRGFRTCDLATRGTYHRAHWVSAACTCGDMGCPRGLLRHRSPWQGPQAAWVADARLAVPARAWAASR